MTCGTRVKSRCSHGVKGVVQRSLVTAVKMSENAGLDLVSGLVLREAAPAARQESV